MQTHALVKLHNTSYKEYYKLHIYNRLLQRSRGNPHLGQKLQFLQKWFSINLRKLIADLWYGMKSTKFRQQGVKGVIA